MRPKNSVFIATSLDGYIADSQGGIDWLNTVPNPDQDDMGYLNFIASVDALVMGRNTYETVLGFGMEWPYSKPVFVLSSTLKEVPASLTNKVFIVHGELNEVLDHIVSLGHTHLYIDGGSTISNFLREDLIDEMTLTTIPILLGGGTPLFADFSPLKWKLKESKTYLNQIVQNHYIRNK